MTNRFKSRDDLMRRIHRLMKVTNPRYHRDGYIENVRLIMDHVTSHDMRMITPDINFVQRDPRKPMEPTICGLRWDERRYLKPEVPYTPDIDDLLPNTADLEPSLFGIQITSPQGFHHYRFDVMTDKRWFEEFRVEAILIG